MDWKTFISSVINSLAWPAVVLGVLLLLKEDIIKLLFRLKRFKHNDTEMEFGEEIRELAVEASAKSSELKELDDKSKEDFKFLLKLAKLSPRSAVSEAYRILEVAMAKAVAKMYPNVPADKVAKFQLYNLIESSKLLPEYSVQFQKLRRLRNAAVHLEDFELEDMPIEAYINIALSLTAKLNNFKAG